MEEKREQLKQELNQALKDISISPVSEIEMQGDIIRGIFFTMMNNNFTPEEIIEVFKDVEISDEKMSMIEENDYGTKSRG